MKAERRIVLKIILGLAAGVLSVFIIYVLNRGGFYIAWAPMIAAGFIGAVAGLAEKSVGKVALGIVLGCLGWICGELFSRLLFHSAATWVFAGGFIGLAAGIMERSLKSMTTGILLGAAGGFMGLAAGFSTIAVEPLQGLDMQATSIIVAAVFINLMLGLKRPGHAAATVDTNEEGNKPVEPDDT